MISEWNKTLGGDDGDEGYSVIETSDGGLALFGHTGSFGAGMFDFWLVKVDNNGNHLWNKTFGGSVNDVGYSIIETSDGGLALFGFTASYGAGIFDFWLVKVDNNGNHLWNKTFGGSGSDVSYSYSIIETSDGGLALFGSTASYGAGNEDSWLIKTDNNGVHQWNKTFGGSDYDRGYSIIETSDSGLAMIGYTESFGAGNEDSWLIKTDNNGNHLWNKTFGGSVNDRGYSIIEISDGGLALLGYTGSFGAGSFDFWLVKVDNNGNHIWNKTFGGSIWDDGRSVIETSDGGLALFGHTGSFGAGMFDFWLIKVKEEKKLQIIDIIPVQVIPGVDLVKDKIGIVRVMIENSAESSVDANISLYFNGEIKDSNTTSFPPGLYNYTFYNFKPDMVGTNLPMKVEVEEI